MPDEPGAAAADPFTGPIGHPHLALIGMMGSGKTTVGRILASQIDREVVDLDARIVADVGMPISEMFATHGEEWFRATESATLERALAEEAGAVLSLGGGAVLRASNRAALRERSAVIWLRASVTTLIERNGAGSGRPLLAGNPSARIRHLTAERAPIYADAAHLVIDVDGLSPAQVAEVVRAAVLSQDPGHWIG